MEAAISSILFCLFAAIAVLSAFGVVASRNPVNSAMCMAVSFASTAAVLFCMGAQFLGIVQIIVYAGAILVLFLFVVMMLDVKSEERNLSSLPRAIVGVIIAGIFAGMVTKVALLLPGAADSKCPIKALCCCDYDATSCPAVPEGELSGAELPALAENQNDVKSLGATLFSQYNIPFVILSFALLAGTVGAVALGRKIRKD
ncbi:MAG: NADH-quinone oxidoreductase subunit J [Akkermansiaceae bacterium]|nr:NADH-quinone oxidoreductase subunit J [Akkermansiaceae bacterium]